MRVLGTTATILLFLFSCAPQYHQFEGPLRGVLRIPPTVYTGQPFVAELFIAGELPAELDDPDYAACFLVSVDDMPVGPSCTSYLPSRYTMINFTPFTKEWFLWRKGWARRIGDSTVEIPDGMAPLMDAEEDITLKSVITIELWLAEPHPQDWAKSRPFKRLLRVTRSLRVDCPDCFAPIM